MVTDRYPRITRLGGRVDRFNCVINPSVAINSTTAADRRSWLPVVCCHFEYSAVWPTIMPLSCHFSPTMSTFACGSRTKELKVKFRQPCEAHRNEIQPPSSKVANLFALHPVASHQQRRICRHPRKWPTFVVQGHWPPPL
jgi:hypothetical protein